MSSPVEGTLLLRRTVLPRISATDGFLKSRIQIMVFFFRHPSNLSSWSRQFSWSAPIHHGCCGHQVVLSGTFEQLPMIMVCSSESDSDQRGDEEEIRRGGERRDRRLSVGEENEEEAANANVEERRRKKRQATGCWGGR